MVLAPRCLHKRSTAPPPFPLAPLFATLQTLIGTDQLVRRVSASPFGLPGPVPASHRRAPAQWSEPRTLVGALYTDRQNRHARPPTPVNLPTAHRFRNAACPPPQFANNSLSSVPSAPTPWS
ncbi:hypothetical protein E5170_03450 [Pseudomonas atacamensis]|uniref:Uncharacterized protein n=1 Tax=Pseudomonas atacamensis TaxID=2565368 RepID=A0AAQ2DH52_9PSED|nr:hypothetical protein E5170_03450 [Pseudomonas atacamensis]